MPPMQSHVLELDVWHLNRVYRCDHVLRIKTCRQCGTTDVVGVPMPFSLNSERKTPSEAAHARDAIVGIPYLFFDAETTDSFGCVAGKAMLVHADFYSFEVTIDKTIEKISGPYCSEESTMASSKMDVRSYELSLKHGSRHGLGPSSRNLDHNSQRACS